MNIETIAIYVRVSTQEQAKDGYSVDEQLDRLRKYCEAHDWKLTKEYPDPGYSGAKLDRPAIQQLIKDVQEGKISKVLVYKLDRLSRSQKDTLYLIEDVFLANNVDFVSMTENFDTSTPFGKAMIGVLSVFAQLEREQIKERMNMGKAGRAKEGRWMGSCKAPIGYRYIEGNLVVDPYEADIVKTIFEKYASGSGVVSIRNYLEKKGYKSSYGVITKPTIYFILHNPVYIGKITYSGETYEGIHDAIISEELFNKCQERFEKNKKNPRFVENTSNFHAKNTFTGMFYCTCGAHMRIFYGTPRKDGTKLKYYGCDSRAIKGKKCPTSNGLINAEKVEKRVMEEIRKIKLDPEAMIEEITEARKAKTDLETDNQVLLIEERIESIEKQIEKSIRLYSIQNIDFEIVTKQVTELTEEKNRLTTTLEELREAQEERDGSLTIEETIQALERLSLEDLNLDPLVNDTDAGKINNILHTLLERIVITPDTIDMRWNF